MRSRRLVRLRLSPQKRYLTVTDITPESSRPMTTDALNTPKNIFARWSDEHGQPWTIADSLRHGPKPNRYAPGLERVLIRATRHNSGPGWLLFARSQAALWSPVP